MEGCGGRRRPSEKAELAKARKGHHCLPEGSINYVKVSSPVRYWLPARWTAVFLPKVTFPAQKTNFSGSTWSCCKDGGRRICGNQALRNIHVHLCPLSGLCLPTDGHWMLFIHCLGSFAPLPFGFLLWFENSPLSL